MAHNRHFLAYTAMMEGRRQVALDNARGVVRMFPPEFVKENALFADAFMTVELDALKAVRTVGRDPRHPRARAGPAGFGRLRALRARRGPGGSGPRRRSRAEAAAFQAALPAVPAEAYWGSNTATDVLAVAVPYLDGEIAYHAGDADAAVARLTEAVALEDALKYDEPPPWTTPARHSLGAVLVAKGRFADAEAVNRADLLRYPRNAWSLQGLVQALEGQHEEADEARGELRMARSRSDMPLETSCLCIRAKRKPEPTD